MTEEENKAQPESEQNKGAEGEALPTPEKVTELAREAATKELGAMKLKIAEGERTIAGAGGSPADIEAGKVVGKNAIEGTEARANEANKQVDTVIGGAFDLAGFGESMPDLIAIAGASAEEEKKKVAANARPKPMAAPAKIEAPVPPATMPKPREKAEELTEAESGVVGLKQGDVFKVSGKDYVFGTFNERDNSVTYFNEKKGQETKSLESFLSWAEERDGEAAIQPPAPLPTPAAPKVEQPKPSAAPTAPAEKQLASKATVKAGAAAEEKPVAPEMPRGNPPAAPSKETQPEQAPAAAKLPTQAEKATKPEKSPQDIAAKQVKKLNEEADKSVKEPRITAEESKLRAGVGAFMEFIVGGASQTYEWVKKLPVAEKAVLWWAKSGAVKQNRLHETVSKEIEKMEGVVGEYDKKLAELRAKADEEETKLANINEAGLGNQLNKNALRKLAKERTKRDAEIAKYASGRESFERKINEKKRKANDYAEKAEGIIAAAEKRIKTRMKPYDEKLAKYREDYDVVQKDINKFIAEQNELGKELAQLILGAKEIQKYRGILMDIDGDIDKIMPTINKWKAKLAEFAELSPVRMEVKGKEMLEEASKKKRAKAKEAPKDKTKTSGEQRGAEPQPAAGAAERNPNIISAQELVKKWNTWAKKNDKVGAPQINDEAFYKLLNLKSNSQLQQTGLANKMEEYLEKRNQEKHAEGKAWKPENVALWKKEWRASLEAIK